MKLGVILATYGVVFSGCIQKPKATQKTDLYSASAASITGLSSSAEIEIDASHPGEGGFLAENLCLKDRFKNFEELVQLQDAYKKNKALILIEAERLFNQDSRGVTREAWASLPKATKFAILQVLIKYREYPKTTRDTGFRFCDDIKIINPTAATEFFGVPIIDGKIAAKTILNAWQTEWEVDNEVVEFHLRSPQQAGDFAVDMWEFFSAIGLTDVQHVHLHVLRQAPQVTKDTMYEQRAVLFDRYRRIELMMYTIMSALGVPVRSSDNRLMNPLPPEILAYYYEQFPKLARFRKHGNVAYGMVALRGTETYKPDNSFIGLEFRAMVKYYSPSCIRPWLNRMQSYWAEPFTMDRQPKGLRQRLKRTMGMDTYAKYALDKIWPFPPSVNVLNTMKKTTGTLFNEYLRNHAWEKDPLYTVVFPEKQEKLALFLKELRKKPYVAPPHDNPLEQAKDLWEFFTSSGIGADLFRSVGLEEDVIRACSRI